MSPPSVPTVVGATYIVAGSVGFVLNLTTILMILTRRVYCLSAYTIMANLALADSIMMLVIGGFCGLAVLLTSIGPLQPLGYDPFGLGETTVAAAMNWSSAPSYSSGEEHNPKVNNSTESVSIIAAELDYQLERNSHHRHHHVPVQSAKLSEYADGLYSSDSSPSSKSFAADPLPSILAFAEVSAWTAGVISYAILGMNRCVAICYYSTRARAFNRVSVAIGASICTWTIGAGVASIGTFPSPLIGVRLDMWSMSLLPISEINRNRAVIFVILSMGIHLVSAAVQWLCSALVLLKIHKVRKKIQRNKLNECSANRFRKQARLTFQFLYPSLFCTISSFLYFTKPVASSWLSDAHLVALHLVWLGNHLSNPMIYAYFNERMRASYRQILGCACLRTWLAKRRKRSGGRPLQRLTKSRFPNARFSRRSLPARSQLSVRKSPRSGGIRVANGNNFVRTSLQLQSRDFEQLCEFMMRVNPLNVSSEGWRESSDEEDEGKCPNLTDGHCTEAGLTVPSEGGVLRSETPASSICPSLNESRRPSSCMTSTNARATPMQILAFPRKNRSI